MTSSFLLEETVESGPGVRGGAGGSGSAARGVQDSVGLELWAGVGRCLVLDLLRNRLTAFPSGARVEVGAVAAAVKRRRAAPADRRLDDPLRVTGHGVALMAPQHQRGGALHHVPELALLRCLRRTRLLAIGLLASLRLAVSPLLVLHAFSSTPVRSAASSKRSGRLKSTPVALGLEAACRCPRRRRSRLTPASDKAR